MNGAAAIPRSRRLAFATSPCQDCSAATSRLYAGGRRPRLARRRPWVEYDLRGARRRARERSAPRRSSRSAIPRSVHGQYQPTCTCRPRRRAPVVVTWDVRECLRTTMPTRTSTPRRAAGQVAIARRAAATGAYWEHMPLRRRAAAPGRAAVYRASTGASWRPSTCSTGASTAPTRPRRVDDDAAGRAAPAPDAIQPVARMFGPSTQGNECSTDSRIIIDAMDRARATPRRFASSPRQRLQRLATRLRESGMTGTARAPSARGCSWSAPAHAEPVVLTGGPARSRVRNEPPEATSTRAPRGERVSGTCSPRRRRTCVAYLGEVGTYLSKSHAAFDSRDYGRSKHSASWSRAPGLRRRRRT